MDKLETGKLKTDGRDGIAGLTAYHAREMTAVKTVHASQMSKAREHYERELARLKEEIGRRDLVIANLKWVVAGLKARNRESRLAVSKPRRNNRK